jgi:Uma2 family endonuclease
MPAWRSTTGTPAGRGSAMSETEWSALGEDEPGELVAGQLVEEEVPDIVHEVVVTWLSVFLGGWLLPRGGVIGGSARFLIGEGQGRKTDVFVFFPGTPKPRRRGASRRPPDIAIEVLSPTPRDIRRDRIEKKAEYARFGVKWYWIVDPEARTIEFHERSQEGRYVHVLGASDGSVEVPACPGLVLDLDDLWRRVDELPDDEE